MIEVKKRKDENAASLIYRFNKRVLQSGVLKEAKKRKHLTRSINKRKRKISALYKIKKEKELKKIAKLGHN